MTRGADRLLRDPDARNDLVLALGLYAFSAVLYWQAARLPPPFFDPLGSAAVPKFVAVVLAVLATLVLVRLLTGGGAGPAPVDEATPPPEDVAARPAPMVALGAVLIPTAYVALMAFGLLGFREASVVFIFAMGALLARFRRRAVLILLPVALLLGLLFDVVFTQVFYVDLPRTFGV